MIKGQCFKLNGFESKNYSGTGTKEIDYGRLRQRAARSTKRGRVKNEWVCGV